MSATGTFWARRRAAVQAEAEAEERAQIDAVARERSEALAQRDDAEILAELELPNPSTLKAGDDFAAFMSRDVPEHLRKMALRKLWRSNPVLACVDGLNEYDDDYRAAMLLQEPIKTAYQVGKGMLKHIEEMERKAKAEELVECDAGEGDEEAETPQEQLAVAAQTEVEDVTEVTRPSSEFSEEAFPVEVPPRRMRFRFDEAGA